MEILLGFILLLACLIIGVRHGGLGLAVISGIGLVIFTFGFGYKPGNPPIDVMLTIMADRGWSSSKSVIALRCLIRAASASKLMPQRAAVFLIRGTERC